MMNRPEKEHIPLEGMDNEQIKRLALFLFEENQSKSKQLDETIARQSFLSAIYNTLIETCIQAGVSFRDYFCKLLGELKKGRTDYENLLPMTICK